MIAARDMNHSAWNARLKIDHTGGVVELAISDEDESNYSIEMTSDDARRLAAEIVAAADVADLTRARSRDHDDARRKSLLPKESV